MAMDTDTRRAFLAALDEDEGFRQEVRQRLLSIELLEMPEKFAAFAAYVNEFIAEQQKFNARVQQDIDDLKEDVAGLKEDFTGLKEDVADLKTSQSRLEGQIKRIADDVGLLKGNVAFYAARDRFELILEQLGFDYVNMLSRQELIAMVRSYGAERIEFADRRSFYDADLVLEATDSGGSTCYVAVEASYTGDRRDSDRATRNSEYLTLFTGHPAYGVIASIENDRVILPLIESGELHWFQLHPEDIQPR